MVFSWHSHIFREIISDTNSLTCRVLAFFSEKHDSARNNKTIRNVSLFTLTEKIVIGDYRNSRESGNVPILGVCNR